MLEMRCWAFLRMRQDAGLPRQKGYGDDDLRGTAMHLALQIPS